MRVRVCVFTLGYLGVNGLRAVPNETHWLPLIKHGGFCLYYEALNTKLLRLDN